MLLSTRASDEKEIKQSGAISSLEKAVAYENTAEMNNLRVPNDYGEAVNQSIYTVERLSRRAI